MSEQDIEAGERWSLEIGKELGDTNFGIICLTSDNLTAPWLLFEAGALSKSMEISRVFPYLHRLEFSDISPTGPLAQFQAKKANRQQTLDLVNSLNGRAIQPDDFDRVGKLFQALWPDLEKSLQEIPEAEGPKPKPEPSNVLEELVTTVRGCDRRM